MLMDSQEPDQAKLDEIAEEFSNAIRRGNQPSIDAFVAKYHDPSGQLRSLLTSIAMIEGLKQQSSESSASANSQSLKIDQLDDYTIVREIGRGGMGVVFEAIHQSLGRRVAVKVLASRLLGDSKHLSRFRREARAAARLRHSNIVPVFGVGQSGEHHYYVMDLIDGMSLRQWLASISGRRKREGPTLDQALANTERDLRSEPEVIDVQADPQYSDPVVPVSTDAPDYFRWVAERSCDGL